MKDFSRPDLQPVHTDVKILHEDGSHVPAGYHIQGREAVGQGQRCQQDVFSILDELDCMSAQTQFNTTGNRITRLVLDRDRIGENAVFRIKGYNRGCIAGRLDFVESLLRREAGGITLEEAELA